MHLIQILLPLSDEGGVRFPQHFFSSVKSKLTSEFGGLTVFMRAPAVGLWEAAPDEIVRDEIAIFEVMAETVDRRWWQNYKRELEILFRQQEIIIRAHSIDLIHE